MSSQFTNTLHSSSNFEEQNWILQIRQTLDEELEDDNYQLNVCIFNVPKSLLSTKPNSYIPQQIALGPYHYCRPDLCDMERYKLSAAKKIKKQLHGIKFQQVVDEFLNIGPQIRSCYHKYLNFNNEVLAWIMAVDACFLLAFLQNYTSKAGNNTLTKLTSSKSHLVDSPTKKSSYNAILRDMVMLENQIPLFLLRKILDFKYPSLELVDKELNSLLMDLCQELCSFKIKDSFSSIHASEYAHYAHLLEYLYFTIVPKRETISSEIIEDDDSNEPIKDFNEESINNKSHTRELFKGTWNLLSKLNKGPMVYLKKALVSKPFKLIGKLPWKFITRIPCFSLLKVPMSLFFSSESKEDIKPEEESGENSTNKPPLINEITIPSVTQLQKVGVRFLPTNGDISSITFDEKTVTLYLPIISLDVNTEVFLRNLVAYEASIASGPLVLARYTELMNGIIDTEEDAQLLRRQGIILNRLKSDEEVANMWNGMNQSVSLTKVPFLDKVIEDVNKYYDGRLKVRIGKCMKTYVYDSWKVLIFLAATIFFFLIILQSFCSVYSCGRFFDDTKSK